MLSPSGGEVGSPPRLAAAQTSPARSRPRPRRSGRPEPRWGSLSAAGKPRSCALVLEVGGRGAVTSFDASEGWSADLNRATAEQAEERTTGQGPNSRRPSTACRRGALGRVLLGKVDAAWFWHYAAGCIAVGLVLVGHPSSKLQRTQPLAQLGRPARHFPTRESLGSWPARLSPAAGAAGGARVEPTWLTEGEVQAGRGGCA